jgi:hypothetical protein
MGGGCTLIRVLLLLLQLQLQLKQPNDWSKMITTAIITKNINILLPMDGSIEVFKKIKDKYNQI